ncbi:hypothetical protein EDL96_13230 [Kocuria soli]|uniref:EamA domain-containing protein n=1 Tax=Kocuria soli TaxID=2485125 RepID=A0A3N3ZTM5_9MICC|nr:EamA family transporter [Kocuria soli]ROZ61495.1 hypothetical protein EDL96_13230 [Kocuria soli]
MHIGILLAIGAAVLFGTAQFLNAAVSARVPGVSVARWTLGGAALVTGLATAVMRPGVQTGTTLWALLAGVGSALGSVALYRSLARGNVSVAVPLATTSSTAIPVAVGVVLLGESADTSTVLGLIAALAAIILVASSHDNRPSPGFHPAADLEPADRTALSPATSWAAVGLPLLAGAGFAAELVGVSQFASDQVISLLWVSFVVALLLLLPVRTRERARTRRCDIATVIVAGAMTATAMVAFHQATQLTGLSTAAVIVGLYPAVPVALAILVLRERPGPTRLIGLACATVAVLTISGR